MVRVHCFIDKEHITYYSPLHNPSVAGTKEQVGFLVAQGCIRALCSALDMSHIMSVGHQCFVVPSQGKTSEGHLYFLIMSYS